MRIPSTFQYLLLVKLLLLCPWSSAQNNEEQPSESVDSLFAPILQVTSLDGYVMENSPRGTLVRVSPDEASDALQILLTDQDLVGFAQYQISYSVMV